MPLTICPEKRLQINDGGPAATVFRIAAWIAENCFSILDAPALHCSSPDTPVRFSIELGNNFLGKARLNETIDKFIELLISFFKNNAGVYVCSAKFKPEPVQTL